MILGIIPARGGSKGIPRKNVKMIAGKPLIAWSIEAAQRSSVIDRLVVSTDDAEIAAVARAFGAEVVDRPAALATDKAPTIAALQHVLSVVKADTVVLLQPTSPIRDAGLIDRCVRKFRALKADNLGTGYICKLKEYGSYHQRRQELQGFFYDDGNVYVLKSSLIQAGKMFGKKVGRLEISREENVEIDDEFDLWLAEQILLKRNKASKAKRT